MTGKTEKRGGVERTVCHKHLLICHMVSLIVAEFAVADGVVGESRRAAPVMEVVRAGVEKIQLGGTLNAFTSDRTWSRNVCRGLRVPKHTRRECKAQVIFNPRQRPADQHPSERIAFPWKSTYRDPNRRPSRHLTGLHMCFPRGK